MISINDIYYRIDSNLVKQNFWEASIEEKKKLIDTELKKYIIFKLNELNSKELISKDQKDLNVSELLLILSNNIPKEEHFNTLRHFTHYIMQVAGNLQNWSITWWIEADENLIDNPLITFGENGLWSSLTTDENTDYVKIFNFVYDVFCNKFMVKNQSKKLALRISDTTPIAISK